MTETNKAIGSGLDWLTVALGPARRTQVGKTSGSRFSVATPQGTGRTTTDDGDGDVDSATQASDRAARASFLKMLQGNGISPEAFRTALLEGINADASTQADRQAAYQSLPSGLAVNVVS